MPRLKLSKTNRLILIAAIVFVAIFIFTYRNYLSPDNLSEQTVEEAIIDTGSGNETRPALDYPNFESVPLADTYLQNEGQGIAFHGKFFPFQVLVWHNLVNDAWNGLSILVVYDPLCGSVAVFKREAKIFFQNSEKIYNDSMLFSTEGDNSFRSSLDGRVVVGSGENLSILPSYVMTWQVFKENFPNGYVLSRQTGAARDYSRDPYGNYAATPAVWYPLTKYDSTYPAKTIVYASGAEVFSLDNIKSSGTISGAEVDFVWDEELAVVRGYDKGGEEVALTRAYWFCWAGQRSLSLDMREKNN